MKKITINSSSESKILIGEKISNLLTHLPNKNVIIITDNNLNRLYSKQFPKFPIIKTGLGEDIKTLEIH